MSESLRIADHRPTAHRPQRSGGRRELAVAGALVLALSTLGAGAAAGDVYDVQTVNDNQAATTLNELVHGSDQWHDLKALPGPKTDSDWYTLRQRPFSSYEVVVEGVSGDIVGPAFQLALVAADGTTVLQNSSPVGTGSARSLRIVNDSGAAITDQRVVVRRAQCAKTCGADDVYRIRAAETTASIPRFNNTGTQVTVLVVQNPTDQAVAGVVYFWNSTGTPVGDWNVVLAPHAALVLSTQGIVPGVSGTMTLVHTAAYGELSGKAIALEPATGFSFDTALVHRAR
jgi:hypothetical protein